MNDLVSTARLPRFISDMFTSIQRQQLEAHAALINVREEMIHRMDSYAHCRYVYH
jgi:hypothetical protein